MNTEMEVAIERTTCTAVCGLTPENLELKGHSAIMKKSLHTRWVDRNLDSMIAVAYK